eukprot:TRINITY_DN319_c0_g1_i4.p1 TRINITY_DN319_c0_g1~~TRINITY_DN319_c0_g1_i4.p1  ORF type:complete len:552 (+),score=109.54 TRINITY_DN319_c0_g1_i4:462-2117(+)
MREARRLLGNCNGRCQGDAKQWRWLPLTFAVLSFNLLSFGSIQGAFARRDMLGESLTIERPAGTTFDITNGVSLRDGVQSHAESFASLVGEETGGTKWALLIAGSSGYWNYRHQADICHAYQVLSRNGLKDENIVVFMYDDIAYDEENPRPGVIINSPNGNDVYKGVPKDYTGESIQPEVFLSVLAGNKTAVKGIGSEKVIASGPEDHVFVFYSDHGGPGTLGMPGWAKELWADQINAVLEQKHKADGFKELVFYLEACESGSIFEGLLKPEWNVYATTASNADESSWATYCPFDGPPLPKGYDVCLGDLYSVSWMEDSENSNLLRKTLHDQYELVKSRTRNVDYEIGSHVMQYGDVKSDADTCAMYMGFDPTLVVDPKLRRQPPQQQWVSQQDIDHLGSDFLTWKQKQQSDRRVPQRDADLVHFWTKYKNAPEGSERKRKALDQLSQVTSHRSHVDRSVGLIGSLIFGAQNAENMLFARRPPGLPIVDDWDCLRTAARTFESFCGPLRQYGLKHMRAFANICNAHVSMKTLEDVASLACTGVDLHKWTIA